MADPLSGRLRRLRWSSSGTGTGRLGQVVNLPWTPRPPGSRLELARAATTGETPSMRNYGQFCPIARGSEILAERWTPIILRNLLHGLPHLQRDRGRRPRAVAGAADPAPARAGAGRGDRDPPQAERARVAVRADARRPGPGGVLEAIGGWAERWTEVTTEHADPDVVLWSWSPGVPAPRPAARPAGGGPVRVRPWRPPGAGLAAGRGAGGRDLPLRSRLRRRPGGDGRRPADLRPLAHGAWSGGRRRCGPVRITVTGPRALRQALPTWNAGPETLGRLRGRARPAGRGTWR